MQMYYFYCYPVALLARIYCERYQSMGKQKPYNSKMKAIHLFFLLLFWAGGSLQALFARPGWIMAGGETIIGECRPAFG